MIYVFVLSKQILESCDHSNWVFIQYIVLSANKREHFEKKVCKKQSFRTQEKCPFFNNVDYFWKSVWLCKTVVNTQNGTCKNHLELDVSLFKNAPSLKPHKATHTAFSTISLNFVWRCTFPEKLSIIQRKKHAACHLC